MRLLICAVLLLFAPLLAFAQTESDAAATTADAAATTADADAGAKALPEIAEATAETEHSEGFMDLHFQPATGKVLLRVDALETDLLYLVSLPTGIGSNDIGLDRGQLSDTRVVFFRRSGRRVLLVERNMKFRAVSDNPGERRAVDEAFAISVLGGFDIVAESGTSVLADVTSLLLSDAYGVASRLARLEEGAYKFDVTRSAPDPTRFKAFPENSVMEAWITLAGDKPGAQMRSVVPAPEFVTLRMRHQFIALPPADFERRAYHPRSGFFSFTYRDYAAGLDEKIGRHLLVRHRLEKKNPGRSRSEAVQPLVYYVDSGAPEPVRQALIDGASWWNAAFEAAGWIDAFQVKVLPPDADPLDLRYNVIQWVHRETRGWSYGWGVIDPRSGEILKGHVSLGSLRVRQDQAIAEGLTAPFDENGNGAAARTMALARLRQLAAHEVGHTLGLAHNFAASSNGDVSVMDYPHPNFRLDTDGNITLADAYASGVSPWDKLAIDYGYRSYGSPVDERRGLDNVLQQAREQGLRFISDPDARGPGAAHAGAHLWDNGEDVLVRFGQLLAVREKALARFSGAVLRPARPWADLERLLVPIYLLHRYQAEAVAKLIGGVDYDYGLRGSDDGLVQVVDGSRQQAALTALLDSLAPGQLALSPALLAVLQPPAYGDARDRENFSHQTANLFDALAPARAAAQLITGLVLHPARIQRVAQQADGLTLDRLLQRYVGRLVEPLEQSAGGAGQDPLVAEVAWIATRELQRLAVSAEASDPVRAAAMATLQALTEKLTGSAQALQLAATIRRFLEDPQADAIPARITVPPGSPI